jgi:hypothetical protein
MEICMQKGDPILTLLQLLRFRSTKVDSKCKFICVNLQHLSCSLFLFYQSMLADGEARRRKSRKINDESRETIRKLHNALSFSPDKSEV